MKQLGLPTSFLSYSTNMQVVREVLSCGLALRVNIDATFRGNLARFFNHRWGGGMGRTGVGAVGALPPLVWLLPTTS